MKKKGIATLALAGALAVSMVPAFAASHQTTVGYTAGGNVSGDGRVMVTVPKDVTFTNTTLTVNDFDVKALVWDSTSGQWVTPGETLGEPDAQYTAPALDKTITVTVESTNGYKLLNDDKDTDGITPLYPGVEGEYKYTLDSAADTAITTDVGTLSSTQHTLAGAVTMTKTPNVGQTQNSVYFSDLLSYTFNGLD